MTLRLRVGVLLPMIAVLTGAGVGCALGANAARKATGAGMSSTLATGKALYRTYCGECHALTAADTAAFGSDTGLGQNGGPSLDDVKVPSGLAIIALTEQRAPRAHLVDVEHMTWQQIHDITDFLAAATATNPHAARIAYG